MKFEIISKYPDAKLPERATKGSAGYDFFVAETTVIPAGMVGLVPTGVKAEIDDGYWLQLAVRSSTPRKKHVMLANGIGIVDSDYYNNPENEGHIMFQLYNFGSSDTVILKGDRIGQGVFVRYGLTDDDSVERLRTGGFGSTSFNSDIIDTLINTPENSFPIQEMYE